MKEAAKSPSETVAAFIAAMVKMDVDTAVTYFAADGEYTNIPMMTVRGPAGVREVLEPFFAPTLENDFIILRQAATGPVVFLERLDRHRLEHGWRELPVNSVFEVHDGLITVWRDYFDLPTAARIHAPADS